MYFLCGAMQIRANCLIRAQIMLSPGTNQPHSLCLDFTPLPLLSHPPTACLRLTWPLSFTCRFPIQYTLTYFPCLFSTSKIAPFQGHPKSFIFPLISLGGRVRAKRFYSVLRARQWRMKTTLQFLSCFLYNPTFWQADISHQLQFMVL
jgi:hypothetical protein